MILMKFLKNRKGFTLIELMMVIAVIGILAAVLIPKMGNVRTSAKETGVEANLRAVQGTVEGIIHRYQPSTGGAADLEAALEDRLNDLVNPVTGAVGVDDSTGVDGTGFAGGAVTYITPVVGDEADDAWANEPALAGTITVSAFVPAADAENEGKLVVILRSFDSDGNLNLVDADNDGTDDTLTITR